MDYRTARPQITSGDIIAFTHSGWGSWADIESQIVRIATRSEYSHVGVTWVTGGRVFILEAVVPEIRIFPLRKLVPFYWVPMYSPLSRPTERYALSRVGQEYSKWEAVKGFFGSTRLDQKWQCAEYVRMVLSVNKSMAPGKNTPTAIVQDALKQGRTLHWVDR